MADPVSVLGVVFGSLQFFLQLKTYLKERKRRKRQQLELQQQQQQMMHLYPLPPFSIPSGGPVLTYCICYHIVQANPPQYNYHHSQQSNSLYTAHPYPLGPLALQAPPFHYPPSLSSSFSVDLPTVAPSSLPTPHHGAYLKSQPSYDWLGMLEGRLELLPQQQAPRNSRCVPETVGMRTGACSNNDCAFSYCHWKSLQEESSQGLQNYRTIAVVDWSKGNIDMFIEMSGVYFRNYRVSRCDVTEFARLFWEREVFSGEIKDQKLKRFNRDMKMVERSDGITSTSSWTSLGIYDDTEDMGKVLLEGVSFIQMVRGAVFGLVCSLYEDPSDLNVDMESHHTLLEHLDIVRINMHQQPRHLVIRKDCIFSVFALGNDQGWVAQNILVG